MRLTGGEPPVCRESQVYLRAVMDAAKRPVKFPQFQIVYTEETKSNHTRRYSMMLCCQGSSAFLRAAWGVARLPLFGAPGAAGCLEVPKCLFVTGLTGNTTWQQNLATEPGTYQGFSHLCHHLHARRLRCRHMVAIANSSLFFAHLNLNLQLASTMNTSNCPAVALGTAATCRLGTVSSGSQDHYRPCRYSYRIDRCLWAVHNDLSPPTAFYPAGCRCWRDGTLLERLPHCDCNHTLMQVRCRQGEGKREV